MRPRAIVATSPALDAPVILGDDDVGMEARDLPIVLALLAAIVVLGARAQYSCLTALMSSMSR
jgi:hypothetical protein